MCHLYLVLIFTQQHFFLLSEVHFYTTVIILGYTFLFYRFLLFCEQQFALNWDFFFLFNRLSIFLIVLLLEGLNKVKSILFETIRETKTHTLTWLSEWTRFLLMAFLSRSCFCSSSSFVKRNGSSRDSGSRSGLPVSFDSSDRLTCSFLVFTLI